MRTGAKYRVAIRRPDGSTGWLRSESDERVAWEGTYDEACYLASVRRAQWTSHGLYYSVALAPSGDDHLRGAK